MTCCRTCEVVGDDLGVTTMADTDWTCPIARALTEALERYAEGDSCQCEDCPQCGRDPAECPPECSRTCQCGWCRYCLALVALGASPRDGDVSAHV